MSWAEIKRAINSRVGRKNFAPLDKIIDDGLNDNLYELCNIFADSIGGVLVVPRVESIPDSAYKGDDYTSVVFPKELKSIGAKSFKSCGRLKRIGIPNSVTSIGQSAFSNCSSLETIQIGIGVEDIPEDMCYECQNLRTVRISNGTKTIGKNAFYNTDFDFVFLPSTIETISQYAFYSNMPANNVNVYYEGTEEQWQNITIETGNARLQSAHINYNYTGA